MPGMGRAQPGEAESHGKTGAGHREMSQSLVSLPHAKCHHAAEGTRAVTWPWVDRLSIRKSLCASVSPHVRVGMAVLLQSV